jgi:hypothetical protein
MRHKQIGVSIGDELETRNFSGERFSLEFIAQCLDEGCYPTRCEENCIVEPDGICPHGFKSIALELGLL